MTGSASTTTTPAPAPDGAGRAGLRSFVRLVGMLRPYRTHVVAAAVIAWLVVAARVVVPEMSGAVIDDLRSRKYDDINGKLAILVGAGFAMALLNAVRRLLAGTISLGLEKTLRDRLFAHLSGLSFTFLDRHQTGQLLSRVTSDVTQVRFFLGYGLTYFFMHFATLVVVPVLLVRISPELSLVVFLMMPLLFGVSVRFSRRSHPVLKEVQQREADVTTAAEENIIGARVVRAFGQEESEIRRFQRLTDRVVDQELEAMRITARYRPLYGFIPGVALSVVVLLAAPLIDSGSLSVGDFFTFYFLMLLLTGPVRIVGNLLSRAQRATASGERLFELLDADEALPVASHPAPLPGAGRSMVGTASMASTVNFERVSFSYRDGAIVLREVDLDIPAGSTVALLGPTGCGKTTLASLVPRFYDPDAGRVLVDGIDVRDLDLRELRQAVGIVNQEPFLFSASVAENVRFGDPEATDDDVWAALEQAQAEHFVQRLPDGIDTMIGERGLTLSGGQRQRIAIARALVLNPRILILDDATASVDSSVEARITSALHSATRGRTTILIAHRPSTIALADHIVMMDHGAVADRGTHDELIERNAMYQQIFEQRAARREFLLDTPPSPAVRP